MDGGIICPNCFSEEFLSDDVMIFDISCSQCDSRFCGECLLEPHYPASCGERYLWDSDDWIPAARERVDLCSSIWDHFNMCMSTVLGVSEQDDVFRSHRCAILEAISFAKWLRVHCITQALLALRLDLPQTILYNRIRGAVRHCEEPDPT